MIKLFLPVISSLIFGYIAFGQSSPVTSYSSYENFVKGSGYKIQLSIQKRTPYSIISSGGNDYEVHSDNKRVTSKYISQHVWGVSRNGILYLNGQLLTGTDHFAQVETYGKYCLLNAALPNRMGKGERVPILYELKTGKAMLLNFGNLSELLRKTPGIREQYLSEEHPERDFILKKYVTLINLQDSVTFDLKNYTKVIVSDSVNIHVFRLTKTNEGPFTIFINDLESFELEEIGYVVNSFPDSIKSFTIKDNQGNRLDFMNTPAQQTYYVEYSLKPTSTPVLRLVPREIAEHKKNRIEYLLSKKRRRESK